MTIGSAVRSFDQQLGEFEILERLGQGGMGAVYKARQTKLKRLVALKTLQPSIAEDAEYIARFEQEAVAAAGLHHPNLVLVYSSGENNGLHWFAMEYVEGESAKGRLKRKGRIDPLEAIAITLHVATALEYGWRKAQLIHRDIKPDNIFLSSEGDVKLGDLGLAKSAGQNQGLTTTGHSMGTPHYISPEQVQDMKVVDFRADIYSLGCTLYHLLSGQAPFDGASSFAIMMKHVTGPVPLLQETWAECPPALNAVVARMMQTDPAQRQQSYAEVIDDLRQAYEAVSQQNVSAPTGTFAALPTVRPSTVPAPAPESAAPPVAQPVAAAPVVVAGPAKKSSRPLAAIIAVLLLVAIGAGLFAFRSKHHPATGAISGVADSPANPATRPSPAAATKDAPFVNSLGMKFVPVPGTKVLFSIWDTRVQDYRAFAAVNHVDDAWTKQVHDGIPVSRDPTCPVVAASWEEAQAFCRWLTQKEQAEGNIPAGMRYRLPTDAEWSCAVGLAAEVGSTPAEKNLKNNVDFPWGKDFPPTKPIGNYADESFHAQFPSVKNKQGDGVTNNWEKGYTDGYATTSPVGMFPANAYGLYDMGGNVCQWCEDWWDPAHATRVMRGAAWNDNGRGPLQSSHRVGSPPGIHADNHGFRCVLELTDNMPQTAPRPEKATRELPFANSLGMKFVPVPGTKVLFSIWDTRVQDYQKYAATNNVNDAWTNQSLNDVPISRGPDDPVVAVNWDEAQAFCRWLTQKEQTAGNIPAGMRYRLPTDEEWSDAVGLPPESGETPAEKNLKNSVDFPWGREIRPTTKVGNYADESYHRKFPKASDDPNKDRPWIEGYDDGYATTSPVGSFPANSYGLYDMGGNVWQWCEDWHDASHTVRVLRGSSWHDTAALSSSRYPQPPGDRRGNRGFRCVLEVAVAQPATAPTPEKATRELPFANSLGMKFVPVPGTKVLFSIWDTRMEDYAAFAQENKVDESWTRQEHGGVPVSRERDHPVVGVSGEEAQSFSRWLTQKEVAAGKIPKEAKYRLPTDEEWSVAAGLPREEGSTFLEKNEKDNVHFPWGTDFPPPTPAVGNYADESYHARFPSAIAWIKDYRDGYDTTSPSGAFPANALGLYDMGGNVWQVCQDTNGEEGKPCVMRGGSWHTVMRGRMLTSARYPVRAQDRLDDAGFRCVLELGSTSLTKGWNGGTPDGVPNRKNELGN